MEKIKCMAVDDEPLALQMLRAFIERTPFLELQGAYLSATEALAAVTDETQALFLDISMPELTGLELARMLPDRVKVVFTTAYSEYASESYSLHAADYLLKPLSYPGFSKRPDACANCSRPPRKLPPPRARRDSFL